MVLPADKWPYGVKYLPFNPIIIEGWEQKRFKCFFSYIHLDIFHSHHSLWSHWVTIILSYMIFTVFFQEVDFNVIQLTLNLLNFLNRIIHLPFLGLSIIIFGDIKMRIWFWSACLVKLRRCADRLSSILVAKTNHCHFLQDTG